MLNLPTIITVFRILLVPFFIMVLLHYRETGADAFRWCALAIFVGAGASDALDGFLARVRNQKTVLGSFLDPLADKLLLISAVLMLSLPLGRIARLPSWFPVLVISRDVVIVLGSALIHILAGRLAPTPVASGKCTTFLQMLTVVWCLARVPQHLLPLYLASAFTVISGVEYIILGLRQLQRVNSSDPRP